MTTPVNANASTHFRIEQESSDESVPCREVCSFLRDYNWSTKPDLMASLAAPNSKCALNLVAWDNQQVIGGLLGYTQLKWLRVSIMAVLPDYQRRGIGTSLLTEAERIAAERGCCYGFIDTLEHQSPGFYVKFGYVESGMISDWDSFGSAKYFLTRSLDIKSE